MSSSFQHGQLVGKNIFVTGGSRGIGAGLVKALAREGAHVAFTYSSSPDAALKILTEIKELYPQTAERHFCLPMNVSQTESIEQGLAQVFEKMPNLDGVVNNAGITRDQLLLRLKNEDFDDVIQTNLRGTFLVTKAVSKVMLKARKGSIVNITSVIGLTGNSGQSNYAASKAGAEAFSKSVAQELGSRSIRVNCVAPGFISTDMTDALTEEQKKQILNKIPLQRLGTVEDVASAVIFLLSDQSCYITGQTLHVNGGMAMP